MKNLTFTRRLFIIVLTSSLLFGITGCGGCSSKNKKPKLSTYESLLEVESALPRPQGMQTMDAYKEIVRIRADFAKVVEISFENGKLNESERDELIRLNRQHALPN